MSFDSTFISKLQQHDSAAFAEFYDHTADYFWRFLQWRYTLTDAEKNDLVHDFYIKFWRVIDQYDTQFGFETRYRTIFRNLIKDYFKSATNMIHEDILIEEQFEESTQLEEINYIFQNELLEKELAYLDEATYTIITLRYLEEKEYHEIAEIVWMTESTVRKRLSRGLAHLKDSISNRYKKQ